MKLHVLFGQRKEGYPGEYGPEALACATEYEYEDNPDYLNGELSKSLGSDEFESLRIVELEINGAKLMEILRPLVMPLPASINGLGNAL